MKIKITTLVLSVFFALTLHAEVETFTMDISGGAFMGSPIPEYTKWFYFSFEQGDTIGHSIAVAEDRQEVINEEWKAREDWDIAFHATDIRTNSGIAGNGNAGALFIADTTSTKPLDEVFSELTEAPLGTYSPDEKLQGSSIFGMAGMPPTMADSISICTAASGWAAVGMGGNSTNQKVIVFKTANDKYAKVYLKQFFGDGTEGNPAVGSLIMDYEIIPLQQNTGLNQVEDVKLTIYPNPVSDVLNVELAEPVNNSEIVIFNSTGTVVKQVAAKAGVNQISISGLPTGTYFVKANNQAKIFIVK